MGRGAWVVVASLVLLVAVIVAVAMLRAQPSATADDARLLAAMERIEQAQARQDERLARLEARSAPPGGMPAMAPSAAERATGANAGRTGNGGEPPDPAVMEAR